MFELQDSKGNRFRLSRGGQSQEHAALALEGNPLQVKRLLKFCDSIALVRAYSFFFTNSTKQPQTKANPTHAKRHRNTLLITRGDHQKITASGIPKAQRPATRTPSPEERLFKAIANGELQLAHTHKVEAFNVARAEKELGLTRSKLLSDSNALVLEKKRLAGRGQHSPWGLIASSEASGGERKTLDARARIIKLNYQRFSASLPNVKKVDGATQQQNITGPQGSGEIQARDMLKALGFSTTKVSTAQYQRAQQQLEQIWKSKNLYKQAREFSSDYAKIQKSTEKAADKELATYELTLCLLLCHDQPIHALASPAPEQINLFSRYKTLGRGFWKAAETARAIEAERETIAGRATAASFDDLAKESSEERERTTPPATLTFIEITLLDDKGEPVANEAYWVKDPEGNEHTGNLDGNGFARIDNIKPGNCQVAFPEIEGSGISQCRADVDCCTPAEASGRSGGTSKPAASEAETTEQSSSAANDSENATENTVDDTNGDQSTGAPAANESDAKASHGEADSSVPPTGTTSSANATDEPKCELSQFEIKGSDSKRGYTLDVISGPAELNSKKGFQIVSNPLKPQKVRVDLAGSCVNGKDCPILEVYEDGNLIESFNSGKHTFKALPKKRDYTQESFTEFYRRFLLPNIDKSFDYETYHVKSCGCEACQNLDATIHAFPNFKWSGMVGLGYADISKKAEADSDEGWFVKGDIGLELGRSEWKYAAKQDFTIDSLFPNLQKSLGGLFDTIKDVTRKPKQSRDTAFALDEQDTTNDSLVNFKFTPPNIALGGNIELKEVEGKNLVDFEGKLALDLNPLVKADLSTDIFDWLIVIAATAATGGAGAHFGKFLVKVKGWAAKRGAKVQAIFNIEGAVAAKLEWTKNAGKPWKATQGSSEAQASLTMGLKAEVSIEKTIWKMSAKAGAELYVKGATNHKEGVGLIAKLQSTEINGEPGIDGTLTFTGLGIYYAYYAELGVKDETSSAPDSSKIGQRGLGGGASEHSVSRKTEKVEKLWTVLDAKTWFKDDKPKTINEAKL